MRKKVRKSRKESQQTLVRSLEESIHRLLVNKNIYLIENGDRYYFGDHVITRDNLVYILHTENAKNEFMCVESAIVFSYYTQKGNYSKICEVLPNIKKYDMKAMDIINYRHCIKVAVEQSKYSNISIYEARLVEAKRELDDNRVAIRRICDRIMMS